MIFVHSFPFISSRTLRIFVLLFLTTACHPGPKAVGEDDWRTIVPRFTRLDRILEIDQVDYCLDDYSGPVKINSEEPLVLLIHGCFSSGGRLRALAEVFAFHGQQALCFNYDDRDSLMKSSSELITALDQLSRHLVSPRLTMISHSQGGLIARKALVAKRADAWRAPADVELELVTLSSPFAGIEAASACGNPLLTYATLGIHDLLCWVVSGGKWYEITSASAFIREPGELQPVVDHHLKIVTDERGSCRRFSKDGGCREDDYVFSLDEQYFDPVDKTPGVTNVQMVAGHTEIVGDEKEPPGKLISVLQERGILAKTPPERREQLAQLLEILY